MPLYSFETLDGTQFQDIFYTMSEVPVLGQEIEIEGIKWKRVFTKPNAAIASQGNIDPYSAKDFNKSLEGKKVTVGDMWDAAKEASQKRETKEGIDPIKDKYYKDYAKERHGVEHPGAKKEKFEKTIKELGVNISALKK